MTIALDVPADPPVRLRYARFSRRLRAMVIDWIITLIVMFGAVFIASTVGNDSFARALAAVVVVLLLLYDPVLVWWFGGTLGHQLSNLRVVDDRTSGNLGFGQALLRALIKALLGWYSFLLMTATRRNQAVHDLLTGSTVQISSAAEASPGDFIAERTDLSRADMPSAPRRVAAIVVCLVLCIVLCSLAMAACIAMGVMSNACVMYDHCSGAERVLTVAIGLALIALATSVIGLGWRGRLPGARSTA